MKVEDIKSNKIELKLISHKIINKSLQDTSIKKKLIPNEVSLVRNKVISKVIHKKGRSLWHSINNQVKYYKKQTQVVLFRKLENKSS